MATGTTRKTTTSTRKTTTSTRSRSVKAAAPSARKTPAKAVPVKAAPLKVVPEPAEVAVPKVVKVSEPAVLKADLKKKDLIDAAVLRSGVKKKYAKPVVETVLELLGEALADGQELNLPPLGKLRINRVEEHEKYRVIVCKLRQSIAAGKKAEDGLAEAVE